MRLELKSLRRSELVKYLMQLVLKEQINNEAYAEQTTKNHCEFSSAS